MDCKYKYKLLSTIKFKLCVCAYCWFFLSQGRVLYPTEPVSNPSLTQLDQFLLPCFPAQTEPLLCQITLDRSGPRDLLSPDIAETLLYQSIATSDGPGLDLGRWIPGKQLFWFSCQHLVQLWCCHHGVHD